MRRTRILLSLLALAACGQQTPQTLQGYAEADYVHVSAPQAGWISQLSVRRGQTVQVGDPLFALDADRELAQQARAEAQAAQARATLANLQKGRRPAELQAIEASLAQARANARQASAEYVRVAGLARKGFAARKLLDAARATNDAAAARVKEVEANLSAARLGARPDEIQAARAQATAAEAAMTEASYALSQRQIRARVGGRIDDTLREAGEFVPSGGAVIRILPPANTRIRFFVPEALRAQLPMGAVLAYNCTNCPPGLRAKITFIASEPEFTPPVIYSVGSREKLVWMMEASPLGTGFSPSPGQPVDLTLPTEKLAAELQKSGLLGNWP